MSTRTPGHENGNYDCIISGGGPVGLLAALHCSRAGLTVLVCDKKEDIPSGSRAIGISPPSLEILRDLGLAEEFIRRGRPIDTVRVFGSTRFLGGVDFSGIPGEYPFILSIPQQETETILRTAVDSDQRITFLSAAEVVNSGCKQNELPWIEYRQGGAETPGTARGRLILACDGSDSPMRGFYNRPFRGRFYPATFVMGDFPDRTDFDGEARLFFTRFGAVESFPLPGGRRRWIVQTETYIPDPGSDLIRSEALKRTGIDIGGAAEWISPFRVRRNRIDRYWIPAGSGVTIFLGDAAHVMSPIGGQGMNTGFADVQLLNPFLELLAQEGTLNRAVLEEWEEKRKAAFRTAADRAARSMSLGTVRGTIGSIIRNLILWAMINGPFRSRVPVDYAMLTIPYRNLYA